VGGNGSEEPTETRGITAMLEPQLEIENLILPHTLGRSLYTYPEQLPSSNDKIYSKNEDFWYDVLSEKLPAERFVRLKSFNLFEWIPRNPGLYHTPLAAMSRDEATNHIRSIDPGLYSEFVSSADAPPDHAALFRKITTGDGTTGGVIYTPAGKTSMLQGGIGCVRLSPIELKAGGTFWFMAATSTGAPDEGVLLFLTDAHYQRIIDQIRGRGFACCDLVGRTKFVSKEMSDLFSTTRGIPRIYLQVFDITILNPSLEYGLVSVAASFLSDYQGGNRIYASYVTFDPGHAYARQSAVAWLEEKYVKEFYNGTIITDFDQQTPNFTNGLFSLTDIMGSPNLADNIVNLRRSYGFFDWSMLEKATFNYNTYQDRIMVKNIISGTGSVVQAVGTGASVSDVSVQISAVSQGVDLQRLAAELTKVRAALTELPDTPERDVLKGAIGAAEIAAQNKDRSGLTSALSALKPFATKILDISEKIGVNLAVAAIKSATGL
jgi:hypothetical protein